MYVLPARKVSLKASQQNLAAVEAREAASTLLQKMEPEAVEELMRELAGLGRVPDDLRWSQYDEGGGCQLTCSECSHGEHTNHFDCPLPSDSYKCINWAGHSGAQCDR